jgi:hypothetical protein
MVLLRERAFKVLKSALLSGGAEAEGVAIGAGMQPSQQKAKMFLEQIENGKSETSERK